MFLLGRWGATSENLGDFHSTKIQVWNFGNSTCPGQWNDTLRLNRPDPSHFSAGCKRAELGTTIGNRRNISVRLVRPTEMIRPVTFRAGPFHLNCTNRYFRNFGLNHLNGKRSLFHPVKIPLDPAPAAVREMSPCSGPSGPSFPSLPEKVRESGGN